MSPPAAAATSSLLTSGSNSGAPIVPKSTTSVSTPSASMRRLTKANSAPLVSSAPMMTTVFGFEMVFIAGLFADSPYCKGGTMRDVFVNLPGCYCPR